MTERLLVDGPFAGTRVQVDGSSLLCEGDDLPAGFAARYRNRRGVAGRMYFDGYEKVMVRVPVPESKQAGDG